MDITINFLCPMLYRWHYAWGSMGKLTKIFYSIALSISFGIVMYWAIQVING